MEKNMAEDQKQDLIRKIEEKEKIQNNIKRDQEQLLD